MPGFRFDGSGKSFQTASVEGTKNSGGSWFAIAHNTASGKGNNPVSIPGGQKTPGNIPHIRDGAASPQRKMASAMIAKIPLPLSQYIGATFYPQMAEAAE